MSRCLRGRPLASQQESLFATEEGKPISRLQLSAHLCLLCQSCWLLPEYNSTHSPRIGTATTASSIVPVSTLKATGRWSRSAFE
ncbi:hypothetical protein AALO_G00049190 [Xyrichtys novacula]|uniref:Uncharacterized protein n=1 Tax=Xyrichtys novacula TaxID=13765 RepID=A0AAV1GLA2_XYRNO|nr:hypothetical protein AALO_G00049190 [Xyrichtys novacula]